MMKIRKFDEIESISEGLVNWRESPDNDPNNEWTIGKLIKELQNYDKDTPIRVGCQGYSNQEIIGIEETDENINDEETGHSTDNYYKVINIVGHGSVLHDDEEDR